MSLIRQQAQNNQFYYSTFTKDTVAYSVIDVIELLFDTVCVLADRMHHVVSYWHQHFCY